MNQNPGAIATLDTIVTHNNPAPGQHVIVHNREMRLSSFEPLLASSSNMNQSPLPSFPLNMDQLHTLQPSPNSGDFEMGDWDTIPMPSPGFWDRLNRPLSPGAFLQSQQFPDTARQNGVWFAGLNYTSPTNVAPGDRAHDLGPIESARLLLTGSSSMTARRQWHCSNEMSPTAEELLEKLQSLMVINAADGYFCDALSVVAGTGVFTDQFIQILLFSIVNDFAGLEGTPVEFVIKFINDQEPARSGVLRYLKNGASTVYSRAFAEKLLKAAIIAGDARTVHDLLALNIVRPDDIVYYVYYDSSSWCERTTAIEEAAKLRQLDIVKLLVQFDADVNKTYKPSRSSDRQGALECAIGLWGEYRPIDIRFVDWLLNNGATVTSRLMSAAIRWGDTTLVEKLMSSISSSEHEYFFTEQELPDAVEYLKNDISYKFVRHMMQACQEIHNNACLATKAAVLVETMTQAARRNNLDLVNLLLPHGGQEGLDDALTGAARFGSHSLVRFLIAHGASVNGDPRHFEGDLGDTTPLASAIRHKDDELIDILAKERAWDQIEEPGRLKAVMIAITESGNLAYLRQALCLVPSPSRQALARPFFFAIKACHEEIALALLEAGADVVRDVERDPLLEALRTKSLSITWAILECELPMEYVMDEHVLEAAIAWGDLEMSKHFSSWATASIIIGVDLHFHSPSKPAISQLLSS